MDWGMEGGVWAWVGCELTGCDHMHDSLDHHRRVCFGCVCVWWRIEGAVVVGEGVGETHHTGREGAGMIAGG